MTDTPALYKMSLSSLSKQLKFGSPDQCQSCSGHLCGSASRPLKGKSGPGYMFICTELIEETGRPPGLIFGLARISSSIGNFFTHLTKL